MLNAMTAVFSLARVLCSEVRRLRDYLLLAFKTLVPSFRVDVPSYLEDRIGEAIAKTAAYSNSSGCLSYP
jgi:hypothetical protein